MILPAFLARRDRAVELHRLRVDDNPAIEYADRITIEASVNALS